MKIGAPSIAVSLSWLILFDESCSFLIAFKAFLTGFARANNETVPLFDDFVELRLLRSSFGKGLGSPLDEEFRSAAALLVSLF